MKNLYIDFDGVICNTIEVTYSDMKSMKIDLNDTEEVRKYYRDLNWDELLERCKIINDAFDNIKKIMNSGKFDTSILTHVNSMDEITSKVKFIRNYLKDVTIIPVPKDISKTEMINARFSILVDDFNGNLDEWKAAGGIGVRFDLDMDNKGYLVIDRLDSLLELF
ncbi:MAG: hypothetical protein IKF01_04125 [Bacilli bacterium]|nr:hypothetical protein [Bacilli bacterium]